jgi:hypothetical protein
LRPNRTSLPVIGSTQQTIRGLRIEQVQIARQLTIEL